MDKLDPSHNRYFFFGNAHVRFKVPNRNAFASHFTLCCQVLYGGRPYPRLINRLQPWTLLIKANVMPCDLMKQIRVTI